MVRAAAEDERVELVGLWTHFATADELDSPFFDEQLERFRDLALPLKEEHPSLLLHAANSAATLREPGSHFDMVRCGIALYGIDPITEPVGFTRDDLELARVEHPVPTRSWGPRTVEEVREFRAHHQGWP